jgi:carbon storage regulator
VLVLTRRPGESVMIGDDVVITVLDVRGDVVRLGIKAPRSVQVHREEVYRELQRVNREAASPSDLAIRALSNMLNSDGEDGEDGEEGHEQEARNGTSGF